MSDRSTSSGAECSIMPPACKIPLVRDMMPKCRTWCLCQFARTCGRLAKDTAAKNRASGPMVLAAENNEGNGVRIDRAARDQIL